MEKKIVIKKCGDCEHASHTGAFTPNGSLPDCIHGGAPRSFEMSSHTGRVMDMGRLIARLNKDSSIPTWCPLEDN